MKKLLLIISILILCGLGGFLTWRRNKADWYGYQTYAFNTECEFFFYGREPDCDRIAQHCLHEMLSIDRSLNRFSKDSAVTLFNQQPPNTPFECDQYLAAAFRASADAYQQTAGAFDVTIGPLMDFWKQQSGRELTENDRDALETAKSSVGFDKLKFEYITTQEEYTGANVQVMTTCKLASGMRVDFGGIAKGLALDLIAAQLKPELDAKHIDGAFLDFGGNFVYLGNNAISIFDDATIAQPEEQALADDSTDDDAETPILGIIHNWHGRYVSTSSNAYRPLGKKADGQKVSHIIEPSTGQPTAQFSSVTAIAANGAQSDAFSTAVFARGRALAEELVKHCPNTAFVLKSATTNDVIPIGNVQFTQAIQK
jgi:FAD:protein FMN transferase